MLNLMSFLQKNNCIYETFDTESLAKLEFKCLCLQCHVIVSGSLERKLAKDKNASELAVATKIRKVSESSCNSNSQSKAVDVTRVSRRNNVTARISAGNLTTEDRMNQAPG
jgi:hypothetical protein